MIRSLLVTLLFFVGPLVLMFAVRHLGLLFRLWLALRRERRAREADVIDVTPRRPGTPSPLFIAAAILIGAVCAFLAWQEMGAERAVEMRYVPAHTDEEGNVVPGRMVPVKPADSER